MIAAIVAPVGDCSIANDARLLGAGSAFLLFYAWIALGLLRGLGGRHCRMTPTDRFFADVGIEILHSVHAASAHTEAHLGHQAGGAGSLSTQNAPGAVGQ